MSIQQFQEHSAAKQYKMAAQMLVNSSVLLSQVMKDYFSTDYCYHQQISNVFELLKNNHTSLLQPYYSQWISQLQSPHHNAFWRNSYRYFQDVEVPVALQGPLYELAFQDMMSAKSPIAVKANAMKTCVNIAKHHKDLLPELREAILIVSDTDSAGVKARSRHMIKEIEAFMDAK